MFLVYTLLFLVFKLHYCFQQTPLDDYVNDDFDIQHVNFRVISSFYRENVREYRLNITTIKWLNDPISTNNIWRHDLFVFAPIFKPIQETGFLYIDGGYNDNREHNDNNLKKHLSNLAFECDCAVALLKQIPNQPMSFKSDVYGKNRIEDEILSYTWRKYFEHKINYKNETHTTDHIHLLMPMTKAIVRTMDILEIFSFNILKAPLRTFILSGESKRGWTSWLAAAADQRDRVVAIVPIIFDGLNLQSSLHHQYRSYGGAFSFAFKDYFENEILKYIDTPEFLYLLKIIDPYYYLDRFEYIKVFMILAANDEFFLPENTKFFWSQLMSYTHENSYIRWLPNIGHNVESMRDTVFDSIQYFINYIEMPQQYIMPKIRWYYNHNFTHMTVNINVQNLPCAKIPIIKKYTSKTVNHKRRDFRANVLNEWKIENQNIKWNSKELNDFKMIKINNYNYKFSYELDNNEISNNYWQAYYLEFGVHLKNKLCSDDHLFYLTTEIFVIPDTYPHHDCFREECQTYLV